jgi:murein DD-endopeptidase MepM/ murein hydrolase activator NlpD
MRFKSNRHHEAFDQRGMLANMAVTSGWRPPMSIKTKIAAFALAAVAVTGSIASSTQPAHAGLEIAAGILGAAVVGSAIAASGSGYQVYYNGYGYRRCGSIRQFDAYGNFIGRVRTCNY